MVVNKSVRPLSKSLRVLIAAGSVGAFLGGWALLAHAPNPYENVQAGTDAVSPDASSNGVQLAPLPTPRARNSQTFQSRQQLGTSPQALPNVQSQFGQSVMPFGQRRMRSGGS